MENRRSFLQKTFFGVSLTLMANACKKVSRKLLIRLAGTKYTLGHRLWNNDFPKPVGETEYLKYVIVGGGISGLSAARYLSKNKQEDYVLLELENHIGGNSSNGENAFSKYPRGAHYLPLPNMHDTQLIQFLQEEKIIKEIQNGVPVFDEFQLSFPPQERLFYRGEWQEDLIPKSNTNSAVNKEFERFFKMMTTFRNQKDFEGKYWFDLPISNASNIKEVLDLDNYTMANWLVQNGFVTTELMWYVDYSCRDDYGMGIDVISAWAGVHYFAARKQEHASKYKNNVLTWPEGNAHLAKLLSQYSAKKTRKNCIVYHIDYSLENGVKLNVYNAEINKSQTIICEKMIVASPQFVNQYLLPERKKISSKFTYAPWIVAAITLKAELDGEFYPLSWDNVIYGSRGLGYVYDQQQSVRQMNDVKVISYYLPFSGLDTAKSRKGLYRNNETHWKNLILEDLSQAHEGIERTIMEIEIFKLGHGMISPVKGFRTSEERKSAEKPIAGKVFFAHTDLSGISVFEEAFHQGLRAAKEMLA